MAITVPASVIPMTVAVIAIIGPIIRRVIRALIDRIRRRRVGIPGVVVRSGSPYRNAERRHHERKTYGRPPVPGVCLAGADYKQKPEGQDCDQCCR
jgi:hypothetical protein